MQKTEVLDEEIVDKYLEKKDIDGLYKLILESGSGWVYLNNMLEIWSLEKAREDRNIFWDVCSAKEALHKYQVIDKVIRQILAGEHLPEEVVQFVRQEISVWVLMVWTLTMCVGIKQIEVMEAFREFLDKYQYDDKQKQALEAVYPDVIIRTAHVLLDQGDGYTTRKVLAKLPCKENIEDLLERADRLIEKVEQTIQYRLNTVTNVEKIGSTYFMVDCWHDRVLYAERLGDIEEWNILDRNLYHPHSICEGKGIYAIENTENGSVCFYIRNNTFQKVGEIEAGKRPHRLIYDKVRDIFWVMAGESQEIYGIRVINNSIMLCFRQKIEELYSTYVRSIRMIDDKFYIVSGPGYILQLIFEDDKFVVEKKYQVPGEYCGMNDIMFLEGYFWITVYQDYEDKVKPALLKTSSLDNLKTGQFKDMYDSLGMKGVPYFFSWVDGRICIPEIDTYNRVVLYDVEQGELKIARVLYDFGKALPEDNIFNKRLR